MMKLWRLSQIPNDKPLSVKAFLIWLDARDNALTLAFW